MSDFWTAALISGSWVLAAIGFAYGRDAAKLAWTAMKQRKSKPDVAVPLSAWPSTIAPCQSWIGREIEATTPPRCILEAEYVAAMRWDILEMSPREEVSDDQ